MQTIQRPNSCVAYAKTQAEQIVLTVQLTELPAAQWIETAFDS